MEKTYTLTAAQIELVQSCIAKAQDAGAFVNCVVPNIGNHVLNMLQNIQTGGKESR